MKRILSVRNIFIGIGVIFLDLAVYIVLGLLLMNYDDFYEESKGEYWRLESMTFWQKVNYIGLNLWHLTNLLLLGYVIYRIIKKLKKNTLKQGL